MVNKRISRFKTGRAGYYKSPFKYIPCFPKTSIGQLVLVGIPLLIFIIGTITLLGLIPVFISANTPTATVSPTIGPSIDITEKGYTDIQVEADNMGKFFVRSRAVVICSEIGSFYDFSSFENSTSDFYKIFLNYDIEINAALTLTCQSSNYIKLKSILKIVSSKYAISSKDILNIIYSYQNKAPAFSVPFGLRFYSPENQISISYFGTIGFLNGTITSYQNCSAITTSGSFINNQNCIPQINYPSTSTSTSSTTLTSTTSTLTLTSTTTSKLTSPTSSKNSTSTSKSPISSTTSMTLNLTSSTISTTLSTINSTSTLTSPSSTTTLTTLTSMNSTLSLTHPTTSMTSTVLTSTSTSISTSKSSKIFTSISKITSTRMTSTDLTTLLNSTTNYLTTATNVC